MDKLNKWLTLGANLGVIVGLIFLGLQIKQNTSQMRANTSFNINQSVSILNSAWYNNPVLSDILLRGENDFSSLDTIERTQFIKYQFDRINLGIHVLALERDGLSEIHFPYVDFLVQEFHGKPGNQELLVFLDAIWVGSRELYEKLLLKKERTSE